jgi:hypothetical protein
MNTGNVNFAVKTGTGEGAELGEMVNLVTDSPGDEAN